MKIVLLGYGKMGRLIEEIALQKEHCVVAKVHPSGPLATIKDTILQQADICIDFSNPESALENIRTIAKMKKNLVMGTTGWYEHLEEAKNIVKQSGIGFLYSPNFSIGVHLFKNIVEKAAILLNHFDDYDVCGFEIHHNEKVDAPSGTAKSLVHSLLDKIERKTHPVYHLDNRPIASHELQFSSLRCGSAPGTHTVIFDSPADTITLSHQARNRDGFARGAVAAAEWLEGKKGFFTLDDMITNQARIPS